MKKIVFSALAFVMLTSCSIFGSNNKNGCPTNGRNVGAEKLASGDAKAIKAARKAGKLKM